MIFFLNNEPDAIIKYVLQYSKISVCPLHTLTYPFFIFDNDPYAFDFRIIMFDCNVILLYY